MDLLSPESARRRQHGFTLYMIAAAVILLAAQGILYLLMLDNTVGKFSIFKKTPPADPALVREFNVVVLKSQLTAQLSPENPNSYYMRARYWEGLLSDSGIPYKIVSEGELPKVLPKATVLVLPGVSCMGEVQRQTIRDFLRAGKGIIASGPLGARDESCGWRSWDFLATMVGANTMSSITPTETSYVGLRSQQPFSGSVPGGYLLNLPSQELALASLANPDAILSDWHLQPMQAGGMARAGVAAHHEYERGRVVWFGFSEVLSAERAEVRQMFDNYTLAALRWAGRQPLAYLAEWPGHNQAAALVAENVHARYRDAEHTADFLKQKKIPATFFVSSTEAGQHAAAVQTFKTAGEVATFGDRYESFTGETPNQQGERLMNAKQALDKLTGQPVVGFVPPYGIADNSTILALNDTGYHYYLNEVAVSRAVPELVEFSSQSAAFPLQKRHVAKIFRTTSDDFELISSTPPGSDVADSFLAELHNMVFFGGVYTLYFHDYLLGSAEYRGTLNRVLDGIKSQPVWIAKGSDLVKWWSGRQRVQVTVRKLSTHRLQLDVGNLGNESLENTSVFIYLPYAAKNIQIRSSLFRLQPPRFEFMGRDDLLRVDMGTLDAQTNYNYIISLDE
jgi:peptidoglycan/xylan/chitin deacetylase (PgdA/CDA1 family)